MMPRDGVSTRIAGRTAEAVCGSDRNHIGHTSLLLCRSDRHPSRHRQADPDRDSDCLAHSSATHSRSQRDADLHPQRDLYCHEHSVRAGDLDSDVHCDSDSDPDPDSDAVHYPQPHANRPTHPNRDAVADRDYSL